MLARLCIAFTVLPGSVCLAQATVINHTNCNASGLGPQQSAQIAQSRSYFAHASVGGNIVNGLQALHTSDPTKYPLTIIAEDGTPPAATNAGTIYEHNRGNPGWTSKVSGFESAMSTGWGAAVGIASTKLCYIDEAASFSTLRNSMVALEQAYPNVTFIYWTMPLTNGEDAANVLRNQFNNDMRAWMALPEQTGKLMLDIADIEAWDPAGIQQTFASGGQTYQKLYSGYTSDGGHLNAAGSERVAMGMYMAYAAAVPEPGTLALLTFAAPLFLRRTRRLSS